MKRKIAVLLALVLGLALLSPAFAARGEELSLSAPSAVLMDADSGAVLFEKNSHEQRPSASITKVMTLILVFEALEAGQLQLEQSLSASAHAASMGGSDIWLKEGEMMSVNDLIKATVIMSANDAAVVLAEAVAGSEEAFISRMNEKAAALGMADTLFKNCNGLDEEGHMTSAHDVALMSRELMRHPDIYNYTTVWMDSVRGGETQLVNTNKLVKSYNGITGLKTGTTTKAGSCITASAMRNDLNLISVVLGAANTNQRFQEAAALLDYGFANWAVTIPENPAVGTVPVKGGMVDNIRAEMPEPPKILLKVQEKGSLESKLHISQMLEAPIAKGDVIGTVTYESAGQVLAEAQILAAEDAQRITWFSSFLYLLESFVQV